MRECLLIFSRTNQMRALVRQWEDPSKWWGLRMRSSFIAGALTSVKFRISAACFSFWFSNYHFVFVCGFTNVTSSNFALLFDAYKFSCIAAFNDLQLQLSRRETWSLVVYFRRGAAFQRNLLITFLPLYSRHFAELPSSTWNRLVHFIFKTIYPTVIYRSNQLF